MPVEPVPQIQSTPAPAPQAPAQPSSQPAVQPSQPVSQPASQPVSQPMAAQVTPDGGASVAAPTQPSWLAQLRETGVDLGTEDEKAAMQLLSQLYKDRQQLAPIAPYVSQYMQHASDFAKYMEQQRSQAAPAPTQDDPWHKKYWNPPEFNQGWERLITQDVNGNLLPAPGAPPDIVPKYLAYRQFRAEQADKFMSNPYEFMAPAIQHLARQEAEKLVEERMKRQSEQQSSLQFVQEQSNWLYEKDQNGQTKQQMTFNPQSGTYTQTPMLSQWGQAFASYVQQEQVRQQRYGYMDIEEQKRNAMALVQRDFAVAQLNELKAKSGSPAISPQQVANDQFLAANNPAASVAPMGGNAVAHPGQVTRFNLAEALRQNFKSNGITDDVL